VWDSHQQQQQQHLQSGVKLPVRRRFAEAQQLAVPWTSSAPAAAPAGLPCLGLLGRCCTVWAADIAAGIDQMLDRRAQLQDDPDSVDWQYGEEKAQVT